MITFRQINTENLSYYIFNDMINIKNFDPNLLNINKISFKNTDVFVYEIKYLQWKVLPMKIFFRLFLTI